MMRHRHGGVAPELVGPLRQALRAEAERFEPSADALEQIRARITARPRAAAGLLAGVRRLTGPAGLWARPFGPFLAWPRAAVLAVVERFRPEPKGSKYRWLRPAAAAVTGVFIVFAASLAVTDIPQAVQTSGQSNTLPGGTRPVTPSGHGAGSSKPRTYIVVLPNGQTSTFTSPPATPSCAATGYAHTPHSPSSSGSPSQSPSSSPSGSGSPSISPSTSGSSSPSPSNSTSTAPTSTGSPAVTSATAGSANQPHPGTGLRTSASPSPATTPLTSASPKPTPTPTPSVSTTPCGQPGRAG